MCKVLQQYFILHRALIELPTRLRIYKQSSLNHNNGTIFTFRRHCKPMVKISGTCPALKKHLRVGIIIET